MAITPDKAAIEQAGLEYVEPHEIVKDTGPRALNLLAQAVVDIQAKPATIPGDIPIFATLAEAEAYEAANPGKTALTIESVEPDTTPPTAGVLAAEPQDTSATLTVSGASDDRSLHAEAYAFSPDGGLTWSAWQAGSTYTATGLTKSTLYSFRHKVRDAAGNEAVGPIVQRTTLAEPPLSAGDVITSDTFTGDSAGARTTDAALGGIPMAWDGNVTTSGGTLTLANNTVAHLPAVLPIGRKDIKVSFTVAALPSAKSTEVWLRDYIRAEVGTKGAIRISRGDNATWMNTNIAAEVGDHVEVSVSGTTVTVVNLTTSKEYTGEVLDNAAKVGLMVREGGAFDDYTVTAL